MIGAAIAIRLFVTDTRFYLKIKSNLLNLMAGVNLFKILGKYLKIKAAWCVCVSVCHTQPNLDGPPITGL